MYFYLNKQNDKVVIQNNKVFNFIKNELSALDSLIILKPKPLFYHYT